MKTIVAALLLSSSAFASTVDSHSLPVFGVESQDSFSLSTITTRTLYRTETVDRICYRTEIWRYDRICNIVGDIEHGPREPREPRPVPPREPRYPDPRPEPRPMPHPVCHDEPVYRTVPYTCLQTISVPYEVTDHQSISNFDVKISNAENSNLGAQCAINFTMTGDNLNTGTSCNEYLALSTSSLNTTIARDGLRINNYNFNIKLMDLNLATLALKGGLTNLHLDGQNLVVTTGDLNNAKNFTLKLFVQRRRFLKSDETLIDRALTPSEFSFVSAGGNTGVTTIDLQKLLGGINASKKHLVKVQLDVVLPSGVVLNNNLPSTHQESEITVWNN